MLLIYIYIYVYIYIYIYILRAAAPAAKCGAGLQESILWLYYVPFLLSLWLSLLLVVVVVLLLSTLLWLYDFNCSLHIRLKEYVPTRQEAEQRVTQWRLYRNLHAETRLKEHIAWESMTLTAHTYIYTYLSIYLSLSLSLSIYIYIHTYDVYIGLALKVPWAATTGASRPCPRRGRPSARPSRTRRPSSAPARPRARTTRPPRARGWARRTGGRAPSASAPAAVAGSPALGRSS